MLLKISAFNRLTDRGMTMTLTLLNEVSTNLSTLPCGLGWEGHDP